MTQTQSYYSGLSSDIASIKTPSYYTPRRLFLRDSWIGRVFSLPNVKLDPHAKLVVFGVSQEYVRLGIPHSHPLKIWYPNVQDCTGLSDKSVASSIDRLVKANAMTKETKWLPSGPTKEKKRRVFVSFTVEFLTNLTMLFEEVEDRDIGGMRARRVHRNCGGTVVNVCTECGTADIPASDVYWEKIVDGEPLGQKTKEQSDELHRMDEYIAATNRYYDAAEIDDDVVDAMGGADAALAASSREIAERMAQPAFIRNGLTEEDLETIDMALREMKGDNAQSSRTWWQ